MNPFQKHDVSDFPDVYVPLAQATRHPSVVANNDYKVRVSSEHPKLDDEAAVSPGNDYSANTVEGLTAEVDFGTRESVMVPRMLTDLVCQTSRLRDMTLPMIVRDVNSVLVVLL